MDTTAWADELCERKLKRDGSLPEGYKQQLIARVMAYADGPPQHGRSDFRRRSPGQYPAAHRFMLSRDDEREQTELGVVAERSGCYQ